MLPKDEETKKDKPIQKIPSMSELWEALKHQELHQYSLDQIRIRLQQKDAERTLYHGAAWAGYLNQIPKALLTPENMLKPTEFEETCLHIAARKGHLKQIPQELLTTENLLARDKCKQTALHHAQKEENLHQIPSLPLNTLPRDQKRNQKRRNPYISGRKDQKSPQ
jgi:ankyrin repeat protein